MVLFNKLQLSVFVGILLIMGIVSVPDKGSIGIFYYNSSEFDKSISYLESAARDDKDNLETLKKIRSYYIIKGNTQKALEYQNKLVSLRPKNLVYLKELEKLFDWNALTFEKLQVMEKRAKLLKNTDKINLYFQIASGYRWLRNYKKADEYFILSEITNDYEQLSSIYLYYLSRKKIQQALYVQKKMVTIEAPDSRMLRLMASTYELTNNHKLAISTLAQLIVGKNIKLKGDELGFLSQLTSAKMSDEKNSLLERIIYLYDKIKDIKSARIVSQKLFELNPKNIFNLTNLANLYLKENIKDKAYFYYKKAESYASVEDDTLESIFYFYKEINKLPDALRVINRLLEQNFSNLDYLERKAETLLELDKKEESLDIYYKILEIIRTSYLTNTRSSLLALTSNKNIPKVSIQDFNEKDKKMMHLLEIIIFINEELKNLPKALEAINWYLDINITDKQMLKKKIFVLLELKDSESAYLAAQYYHSLFGDDFFLKTFMINHEYEKKEYEKIIPKTKEVLFSSVEDEKITDEDYYSLLSIYNESLLKTKDINSEIYFNFCNTEFNQLKRKKEIAYLDISFECAKQSNDIRKAITLRERQINLTQDEKKKIELMSDIIYLSIDNQFWDIATNYLDNTLYKMQAEKIYSSQKEYLVMSQIENNKNLTLDELELAIEKNPSIMALRTKYIDMALNYKDTVKASKELNYLKSNSLLTKENKKQLKYLKEINDEELITQALLYAKKNKPYLAINQLENFLKNDPHNNSIRDNLFYLYLDTKNIPQALNMIIPKIQKQKKSKEQKEILESQIQYLYTVDKEIKFKNRFEYNFNSFTNYNKFYQYSINNFEISKFYNSFGFYSKMKYFQQTNLKKLSFFQLDAGGKAEFENFSTSLGVNYVYYDYNKRVSRLPLTLGFNFYLIENLFSSITYNHTLPEYSVVALLEDNSSFKQTLETYTSYELKHNYDFSHSFLYQSTQSQYGPIKLYQNFINYKKYIGDNFYLGYTGILAYMNHSIQLFTNIFPKKYFINYSNFGFQKKIYKTECKTYLGLGMDPFRKIKYLDIFKFSIEFENKLTKELMLNISAETNNQLINGFKSQVYDLTIDIKRYF